MTTPTTIISTLPPSIGNNNIASNSILPPLCVVGLDALKHGHCNSDRQYSSLHVMATMVIHTCTCLQLLPQ